MSSVVQAFPTKPDENRRIARWIDGSTPKAFFRSGTRFRARPFIRSHRRHHDYLWPIRSREDHAARLHRGSDHSRLREDHDRQPDSLRPCARHKCPSPTPQDRIRFSGPRSFSPSHRGKNIEYGLPGINKSERQKKSDAILESFRISHLRDRKPAEISGGERQRVALARALVTDPCVLLLDEPLAALDAATKSKIIDDLRAWNAAHAIPILYITHNREEVFALGDRVLVLENGRIIADGTPHGVMAAPRRESLAQLIGFENIFHATVTAVHEDRGTMTCRLANSTVELETPLVRADVGTTLLVGIRAGDILLATVKPEGLSARNILPGRLLSLEQRDVIVAARANCGVEMEVHVTLAARDSLQLHPGREVWLIVKTHSCHLMAAS